LPLSTSIIVNQNRRKLQVFFVFYGKDKNELRRFGNALEAEFQNGYVVAIYELPLHG
jgi:hypothetical protein